MRAEEHLTVLTPAGQHAMRPLVFLQELLHTAGYRSSGPNLRPTLVAGAHQPLQHTGIQLSYTLIQTILETARCRYIWFPAQVPQGALVGKGLSWVSQIAFPGPQILVRASWWTGGRGQTERLNDVLETFQSWYELMLNGSLQCAGGTFEPIESIKQR